MSGFEGYRNYPTWRLALFIDEDYDRIESWVMDMAERGVPLQKARQELAKELESYLCDVYDETYESSDPLASAVLLQNPNSLHIDYAEVAEHFPVEDVYEAAGAPLRRGVSSSSKAKNPRTRSSSGASVRGRTPVAKTAGKSKGARR